MSIIDIYKKKIKNIFLIFSEYFIIFNLSLFQLPIREVWASCWHYEPFGLKAQIPNFLRLRLKETKTTLSGTIDDSEVWTQKKYIIIWQCRRLREWSSVKETWIFVIEPTNPFFDVVKGCCVHNFSLLWSLLSNSDSHGGS